MKKKKVSVKKVKSKKKVSGNSSRDFVPSAQEVSEAPLRAKKIISILKKTYPDARCELYHGSALELLVATMLSAQCTDERVNKVTPGLFKKYGSIGDFAKAKQEELEEAIRSTGFFRNKAKNIIMACQDMMAKHGGRVPEEREALVSLAGVGRKTANVVLGNVYGQPAVVTDTHVIRLSRLMGLSLEKDPVKLEHDLMGLFAKKDWTLLGHLLIFHGRRVCIAGRPKCLECPVSSYCCYGCSLKSST